jgi:hypothetical protein
MRLVFHALLILASLTAPGTVVSAATPFTWSFAGERVYMRVTESEFVVDAHYDFERGAREEDLVIRYPFPSDTTLGVPELMGADVLTSGGSRGVDIVFGPDGWRWVLKSSWGRVVSLHLTYRQAIRARHATYILTSTKEWQRPLGRAVLEVSVPLGVDAEVTPYLPSRGTRDGALIRRAELRNWTPREDLVIRFR